MKCRVIVQLEAEVDITEAAAWYERQGSRLGHAFLGEIESAFAGIAENPFRYPRFRNRPEVRRALCNRFPYRIFFVRRDEVAVIFRVLHGSRSDSVWETSVPND